MIQNTVTGTTEAELTSSSPYGILPFIRWFTIITAFGVIGVELYRLWIFYVDKLPNNDYSTLRIIGHHIQTFTWISLPLIAILIIIRSKSANTIYIALFLACYCAVTEFSEPDNVWLYTIILLASIIVGILFILSMQYFPRKITSAHVDAVIRPRWLRWYLRALLQPLNRWIYLTAILTCFAIAEYLEPLLAFGPGNFLILLTGFAYLLINYRLTSGVDRARILWLFWGLTMYIMITALYSVVYMYSTPGEAALLSLGILATLILLFSFVMSFFFADAFDTGIFVRKTAVNAILFLLVVFAYNTLEHYVLHWISHTLHLSNAVVSSLASGFIVLCISPLHHRLTHFLNKKLKGHPELLNNDMTHRSQPSSVGRVQS